MANKNKAVIGIGGNLPSLFGDCRQTLLESVSRIGDLSSVRLLSQSPIYRSEAWPLGCDQPDFANMAIGIEVGLNATELLEKLHNIENDMGRVRSERWGPRVIDLDLLAYGDLILPSAALWHSVEGSDDPAAFLDEATVPHPRLHKRPFAIIPFADVYPDWQHPVLHSTAENLAQAISNGEKHPLKLFEG